jgi:LPXTG-motif cell wall-anchored protein
MKYMIRNTAAAAVLVAGAILAMPLAADAATIYPPANVCSTPATAGPSGTIAFKCADGTFAPHEKVTITVEGENGAGAKIGFVAIAAVTTASGTAESTSSGALAAVPITLPSNASGVYNISAVSASSSGGTASVSISTTAGSGSSGSSGSTLPVTGIDAGSLLGVWIGGGALVLAGGAIAVATSVRRNRKHAES